MTAEESRGTHAHGLRPATAALCLLAAAGLWVIFVATSNPHEMEVGAVCVAATVIFTGFVVKTTGLRFKLQLRDFLQGWRIPWYVLSDFVVVAVVLVKDVLRLEPAGNLFRVCGFDTSKHDPVRIARTVLAVTYSTCSPNCIVIGIDQSQSRMLFHQLKRSAVPSMTRNLGAKG